MKPLIPLVVSALVVTAAPVQIPEQPKWEISFSQVEAAAGLSNLRGAEQDSLEARVMQRAWSFAGPLPFLRLTRIGGAARATGFLYWRSPGDVVPSRQPTGPDVVCRDGICVRPIGLANRRNWQDVIDRLASEDACPPRTPDVAAVCGDCDHIWIKTRVAGQYREQSCQQPAPQTVAYELLELMKTAAQAAQRNR